MGSYGNGESKEEEKKTIRRPGYLSLSLSHSPTHTTCLHRKLRAEAAELIDDESRWEALYCLEDCRTARGATGLLQRAHPGPWRLYETHEDEEPPQVGKMLLETAQRPPRAEIVALLNAAAAGKKPPGGGSWWGGL